MFRKSYVACNQFSWESSLISNPELTKSWWSKAFKREERNKNKYRRLNRNQTLKKCQNLKTEIYYRKMCFAGCIAAPLNSFNVNFCCNKNSEELNLNNESYKPCSQSMMFNWKVVFNVIWAKHIHFNNVVFLSKTFFIFSLIFSNIFFVSKYIKRRSSWLSQNILR